jgi:Putative lumazine-binding
MREGDSEKLKFVLHDQCRLMTVYRNKEARTTVYEENVVDFVRAVGLPHEEMWDERISKVKIMVDGDLAQAWMNYEFYLDDQFSHKGVNAFQFVRTSEGWKVIRSTDMR